MIKQINKNQDRLKRHKRVRLKVKGTVEAPRLSVYRTLDNIYAQIIDDVKGHTLVTASTLDKEIKGTLDGKNKKEQAYLVGELLAKKAKGKKIGRSQIYGQDSGRIGHKVSSQRFRICYYFLLYFAHLSS